MEDTLHKKLSSLTEISKCQLSKILNHIPGPKDLILEPDIIKPLERICGVSWLNGNGVQKIFKLEQTAPKLSSVHFFMIYTNYDTFKAVVDLIQSQLDLENPVHNKYHIVCIPKVLYYFEDTLESLGLYHSVIKLYSLQWQPIHLDTGLLSLEIPRMYKMLYVKSDYTLLPAYAKSLWHLFFVVGKPAFTLCLGQFSNIIIKQLDTLLNTQTTDKLDSDFGGLVILDRNMDYPSALLSPGTYTALLKEVYNVHCGVCEWKEAGTEKYDEKFNPIIKKQPITFPLDSTKDSIYKDIKNRYFTEVTAILSILTKELKSEGESSKEMALDEIKNYVKTKLQAAQSKKKFITNHLIAAETIINTLGHKFERQIEIEQYIMLNKNKSSNFTYLEEMLQCENNRYSSLALFCLLAITQKVTDNESKSFLHKYLLEFGYDLGIVYNNLIKANFISEINTELTNLPSKIIKIPTLTSNTFYANMNKLKQVPNDPTKIDLRSPTCCSYVFKGCYIPLISKICSLLFSSTPLDEVKNKLGNLGPLDIRNNSGYPLQSKSLLVYVVGGITYSEVAACNLLESLTGSKIVLLSDKYICGNDIADALITVK